MTAPLAEGSWSSLFLPSQVVKTVAHSKGMVLLFARGSIGAWPLRPMCKSLVERTQNNAGQKVGKVCHRTENMCMLLCDVREHIVRSLRVVLEANETRLFSLANAKMPVHRGWALPNLEITYKKHQLLRFCQHDVYPSLVIEKPDWMAGIFR